MGVIRRQSIKQSVVSYVGVGIGAISSLFIYPLDLETYGFLRFMIDSASLLAPIALLGIHFTAIRFYPRISASNTDRQGFLPFILMMVVFGFLLTSLIYFLLKDNLESFLLRNQDDPIFSQFVKYILPIALLVSLGILLTNYISIFRRIVVPAILNNIFLKVGTASIVLLSAYSIIKNQDSIYLLAAVYLFIIIGLGIYLKSLGELQFSRPTARLTKLFKEEMLEYSLYAMVTGIATILAFRIDTIMVSTLIDLKSTGVYSISLFLANAIAIPTVAVRNISGPIISDAWTQNQPGKISSLYKSTSLHLTIFGLLLYLLIMVSIADLVSLMPNSNELQGLIPLVAILGASKLIEMSMSVNNQIIVFSDQYKFNLVAVLILAVLNIFLTYFFIKVLNYGIIGAAMAAAISLTLYNLTKFLFIHLKFKMHPFSHKYIWIVLITTFIYLVTHLISFPDSALLKIIIKSIFVSVFFVILTYIFKVSEDFNTMVIDVYKKFKDNAQN